MSANLLGMTISTYTEGIDIITFFLIFVFNVRDLRYEG